MTTETKRELIAYTTGGEWTSLSIQERHDGLWRVEWESRIQGQTSGRVVLLKAPDYLHIEDEADFDSMETPFVSKLDRLLHDGQEVRCLRRGYRVQ